MNLLSKELLIKTSDVDHADWNYSIPLGFIQRMRFRLCVSLLSECRFHRLLEIGYGSGVFMPELARHCDELYGIDLHNRQEQVSDVLQRVGATPKLFSASVTLMPFCDNFFDCIVAVSTLEYVADIDAACREIKRILEPGGLFIVVTPGYSPLVDFGLRITTCTKPRTEYGSRRENVIPTLKRYFSTQKQLSVPPFGNSFIHLYQALKLSN